MFGDGAAEYALDFYEWVLASQNDEDAESLLCAEDMEWWGGAYHAGLGNLFGSSDLEAKNEYLWL